MEQLSYEVSLEGDFNQGLTYVIYIDGKEIKRRAEYPSESEIYNFRKMSLMSDIEAKMQYIKNKYCWV
jgi:hypothetical protein